MSEIAASDIVETVPSALIVLDEGLIELIVADDGIGMRETNAAKAPEKRGSDYVAIFVRQLGGSILAPDTTQAGTTVTVRFPLHVVPPTSVEGLAA